MGSGAYVLHGYVGMGVLQPTCPHYATAYGAYVWHGWGGWAWVCYSPQVPTMLQPMEHMCGTGVWA